MSTVAALAVASPVALATINELSASTTPAPQHREFVQAALVTDLPGELLSALSQGLSQFGINLPPMPTGVLTGSPAASPVLTSPGLGCAEATCDRLKTRAEPVAASMNRVFFIFNSFIEWRSQAAFSSGSRLGDA